MRILFAALALFWAGIVMADGLPALFDVTDVAADDVLNVRAAPSGTATIIGVLAPDARAIEVINETSAGWGQIRSGEGTGWVAVRFLRRRDQEPWWSLSHPLACGGTEPFWNLALKHGRASLDSLDGSSGRFDVTWSTVPRGRPPLVLGLGGTDLNNALSAVIRRATCSDGMSDLLFGLEIDLFVHGPDTRVGLSGCCQLLP